MFYLVLTIGKNIFLFMDLPCPKTNAKKVFVTLAILLTWQAEVAGEGSVTIVDGRHYSNVFGETRNYRVFLPPGYDAALSKNILLSISFTAGPSAFSEAVIPMAISTKVKIMAGITLQTLFQEMM